MRKIIPFALLFFITFCFLINEFPNDTREEKYSEFSPSELKPVSFKCLPFLEINQHFVDWKFWKKVEQENLVDEEKKKLQEFMETIERDFFPIPKYKGRGIIFLSGERSMERTVTSIKILHHLKTKLPIQIWYFGDELNDLHKETFLAMNVELKNIQEEKLKYHQFKSLEVSRMYGNSRNYHFKTLALLLSEFEEILYLDSDNMALRNPEYLFDTKEFRKNAAVFWPDFWKFPISNPIWGITELQCLDEYEQEAGQLLLNKRISFKPLILSLFFQLHHEFYFKIMLGDKDTFRFSWKLMNSSFHMVQHQVSIAGRVRGDRFCGHSMVQKDPDGKFLFLHTTALKSTHSIHRGNTWETIQQLDRIKPHISSSQKQIISYPFTVEYGGGMDNPSGSIFEKQSNPCLEFGIKHLEVPCDVNCKTLKFPTYHSYKITTQTFNSISEISWFEDIYYDLGGIGSEKLDSGDGYCGNGSIGNGKCADMLECCSSSGWCGNSLDYCGLNCEGGNCIKSRILTDDIKNYCGGGDVGFGLCKDGSCCSVHGWCGKTEDHCRSSICLSGKCLH